MRFATHLIVSLEAASVLAVSSLHKRAAKYERKSLEQLPRANPEFAKRDSPDSYLTPKTAPFRVNGSALPDVDFDIGESYAGTLSINSNPSNENKLFFWFFPSDNPKASNEITIWLNGGPGCSSLDGLLQENGPFLWQSGTYAPQPNPFSFVNLTNMVYVDQPIGTGFSPYAPGAPQNITNEEQVAADFAGFFKNFMSEFNLTGRDVYITGESYAGQYIPYIADYFLNQSNTEYYNLKGIQINDPSIGLDAVLQEVPAVTHLMNYENVFALNDSFVSNVNQRAEKCGYFKFMEEALTFPPKGKFVAPNATASGCDVWDDIVTAAIYVNPCFNIYHLTDVRLITPREKASLPRKAFCPFLWDVLGFPSLGAGPNNYFNNSEVQKVIHAPPTNYTICGDDELGINQNGDGSPPSSFGPLPRVIEKTNNVIVGSGMLDYLLMMNGTLMTLNNMTWNGKQGFSSSPLTGDDMFVPYNPTLGFVIQETETQPIPATPVGLVAGGGLIGKTHTERGLTFTTVDLAGHEIPQYVPGASYRQLEFLLGRIANLTVRGDFTTQSGNYTGTTPPSPYYPSSSPSL